MSEATKIVILAMLFLNPIPQGQSIAHTFCVGTGYSNGTDKGLGFISMGASAVYNHPVSTFWGANPLSGAIFSRQDAPKVRIHSVSETLPNGNTNQLRGWLYLEIEKPANQYFNALAVWAFTPQKRTSGEFVFFPKNSCDLWSDLKNYAPCSAVAVDMPVTTNMFIYTDIGNRKQRVFKLLWRLSSSHCNKPAGVHFIMAFNSLKWNNMTIVPFYVQHGWKNNTHHTTDLGPMLIQSRFIYTKFFGTSAPVFNASRLLCTSPNSLINKTLPNWISRLDPPVGSPDIMCDVNNDWIKARWDFTNGDEITYNTYLKSTCQAQESGFHAFGGRCNGEAHPYPPRTYADDSKSPECIERQVAWSSTELHGLRKNGNFTIILQDRSADVEAGCDQDCKNTPIPTKQEILRVASRRSFSRKSSPENSLVEHSNKYISRAYGCADRKNETDKDLFGLCSLTEAGQAVNGVRQWHGFVMLVCSVILIPMQCFLARYFKGPIPISPKSGEPYIPVRPWYIAHILLTIPVISLFSSAMSSVRRQIAAVGYSKTLFARTHFWLGYIFFAAFVFQILTGFLRPLNIPLRRAAIIFHWLLGTILNYGGVVLCMFTYGIPSAPTSHQSHLKPETFNKIYYHVVPMILVVWFVFEGLFHIPMFIYAVKFDRKHNIYRTQFPVFLPPNVNYRYLILEGDYRAKAALFAKAFKLYVATCSLNYVACCLAVFLGQGEDGKAMGLGPMSCTHDENNKYISVASSHDTVKLRQFYIDNNCHDFLSV